MKTAAVRSNDGDAHLSTCVLIKSGLCVDDDVSRTSDDRHSAGSYWWWWRWIERWFSQLSSPSSSSSSSPFFLSHFFFLPSSQTSSAPNETIEKTTAERTRPMKRNDDVVFDVSIGHAVTPVFFFSFLNFLLASMFELESVLSVASMSPSLLGPQFYGEKNGYKWNQVWKAH